MTPLRGKLAGSKASNGTKNKQNSRGDLRVETKKTTRSDPSVPPELTATQDELDWILDGLPASSAFNDLLAFVFSNAGRTLILRVGGTAQRVVDRLVGLPDALFSEVGVCRAVSVVLLVLTMCGKMSMWTAADEDGGTGGSGVIGLVGRVVAGEGAERESGDDENGIVSGTIARNDKNSSINTAKYMSDPHVVRVVPREVSASPLCVVLATLSFCLVPREEYDASRLKRRLGPLIGVVAAVLGREGGALNDPNPTLKTVVGLWKVKTALLVLEQACFACEEVQRVVNGVEVEMGCAPPLGKLVGFNQFLVSLIRTMSGQNRRLPSEGIKKDCFLLLISVLMNTTEGDERACREIEAEGGREHLCSCIVKLWNYDKKGTKANGYGSVKREASVYADEMSALLGVLINVVDEIGCEGFLEDEEGTAALVDVLCDMTKAAEVVDNNEHVDDGANGGGVTVECLDRRDARQKSSAEAYGSILLGFLVVGSAEVRGRVMDRLEGIEGVKMSIERTLAFYLSVGAVTDRTKERLSVLVASL